MPTSVPLPVAVCRVSGAACYLTARAEHGLPADAVAVAVEAEVAALAARVPAAAAQVPPVVVRVPAVAAVATPAVVVEVAVTRRVARVALSSAPGAAAADRV
nr:hypothetical protein MFLOJ_08430 [Mycobacterium florentinum]